MKKLQAMGSENGVPHILYDLSLPLEERKQKAMLFDTASKVAQYLGVKGSRICDARKIGRRIKGRDNKWYAVRIAKVSEKK